MTLIVDRDATIEDVTARLPSTLYHELHHRSRIAAVGFGETLKESLVTEGLAKLFEEEMGYAHRDTAWFGDLTSADAAKIERLFGDDRGNHDYSHSDWFYGSKDLPRWTGYILGYKVVSDYLAKTGKKASELHVTPHAESSNELLTKPESVRI